MISHSSAYEWSVYAGPVDSDAVGIGRRDIVESLAGIVLGGVSSRVPDRVEIRERVDQYQSDDEYDYVVDDLLG
ncbi:hypothetical protein [Natrinema versiforme]|uniref:Uncharacterized protein n=1 Tax=Natrinema versiforme TaxID=88724 RepID=A0A4V1G090_9EURY|nr:hypothetical protein [Natrinema versiforme]QCS44516.1 hypothetical protein FEJ81_19535 [Natrinema versiforme]